VKAKNIRQFTADEVAALCFDTVAVENYDFKNGMWT